jgi:zinc transporter 1/2/3
VSTFNLTSVGAYQNLQNECLDEFTLSYDWAGLIAMSAILAVHLIEFVVKQAYTAARKQPESDVRFKTAGGTANTGDAKVISPISDVELGGHSCHSHGIASNAETDMKKVTVAILEIGIAAHSVIIGIALGVATGSSFPPLLIAICFHQLFEGLALGSTIAQAGYGRVKSLLLGGVYALTTPLGMSSLIIN